MIMIYVETDYHCWARYASQQQFDAEVQSFLAANNQMLARPGAAMDMQMEPTERAWEMVSTLRRRCRFPADLEMEIYAGIVGNEAAAMFLGWCAENRERPVSAEEVLDDWPEVAGRVPPMRSAASASTPPAGQSS